MDGKEMKNTIISILSWRTVLVLAVLAPLWRVTADEVGQDNVYRFEEAQTSNDDVAGIYRDRGRKALDDGMYQLAIANLRQSLQQNGQREEAYAEITGWLAEAYLSAGQLAEAQQVLEAHEFNCTYKHGPELANWLVFLAGQALFRLEKWQECRDKLSSVLEQPAGAKYRIEAILLAADASAQLRKWDDVIKLTRDELVNWQGEPPPVQRYELLQRVGDAWLIQKKYNAINSMVVNLTLPDDPELRLSMVTLQILSLAGLKEYDGAMEIFRANLEGCPFGADAKWWKLLWYFGDSLADGGRYAESEEVLAKALNVAVQDSERVDCLIRLSEARLAQGKKQNARDALAEIRRSYPGCQRYFEVSMRLGELLRNDLEWDSAVSVFGELLANAALPADQRYKAGLQKISCLIDRERYAEVLAACRETAALTSEADFAAKLLMQGAMAAAREGTGLEDEAIALFREIRDKYESTKSGMTAGLELGRLFFRRGDYRAAMENLDDFVKKHPEHAERWNARLQSGIASTRLVTNRDDARQPIEVLKKLAVECSDVFVSQEARQEAYRTAEYWRYSDEALAILETMLQNTVRQEEALLVKFRRLNLEFSLSEHLGNALKHSAEFLDEAPQGRYKAEVLLQLGDYYASQNDYVKAEKQYEQIAEQGLKGQEISLEGLYETAYCRNKRPSQAEETIDYEEILSVLDSLFKEAGYSAETLVQKAQSKDQLILAKSEMLYGDILAQHHRYDVAEKHFASVRILAGDTDLGFAGLGRRAQMLRQMSLTESDEETRKNDLSKAITCLNEIMVRSDKPALQEMAKYNLAQCYKDQISGDLASSPDLQKAISCYESIYNEFKTDRDKGAVRDSHYYFLSVFELTDLYKSQADRDSLLKAARVYEDLYSHYPEMSRAREAEKLAREIREKQGN